MHEAMDIKKFVEKAVNNKMLVMSLANNILNKNSKIMQQLLDNKDKSANKL
jgi:hypothetical protein